ncbi:MAG: hypothetical protein JWN57_2556 [Frankiales bacterium]|nr:hypothetical protein [Frankiales bacterium]
MRAWVPSYAAGDSTSVPWFIAHIDPQALTDEALEALAEAFDPDTEDVADAFQLHLEEHGYLGLHSPDDNEPGLAAGHPAAAGVTSQGAGAALVDRALHDHSSPEGESVTASEALQGRR